MIAGKKKCAMPSIAAAFIAGKRSFSRRLLDFVGINFRICGISIDPGHPGDVFDVGYVLFERSPEAAEPPPERQMQSCKRKQTKIAEFQSTVRVAGSSSIKFFISSTCNLFEIRRCVATAAAVSRGTTIAIAQT